MALVHYAAMYNRPQIIAVWIIMALDINIKKVTRTTINGKFWTFFGAFLLYSYQYHLLAPQRGSRSFVLHFSILIPEDEDEKVRRKGKSTFQSTLWNKHTSNSATKKKKMHEEIQLQDWGLVIFLKDALAYWFWVWIFRYCLVYGTFRTFIEYLW